MTRERVAAFCGGSPIAERFDPPVTRHRWNQERDTDPTAFLAYARDRCGLDARGLARVFWHGGFYIDGVRLGAAPTEPVRMGQRATVYVFNREPEVVNLDSQAVLFDEAGVLAVAKPPWVPMQGTRASHKISLETQIRELTGYTNATPIHRLDRQTSGVVLFAHTSEAASWLSHQFRRRRVEKTYLAWTHPEPQEQQWTVRGSMVQVPHPHHACFALCGDDEDGRDSETDFRVITTDKGRALVRATPRTGRTHQIRVHLAAGKTPIAGDTLYGPRWSAGHPACAPRVLLHAESLTTRLGRGLPSKTLGVPPPEDFPAPPPH